MRKPYGKMRTTKARTTLRRKLGIRKKVVGSNERPRICVISSNKNLQVQVVDDGKGATLFSVQTFGKKPVGTGANLESAGLVGKEVGNKLKALGIQRAVFDRNGKLFGKTLASIVEQIRGSGIQI